MNVEALEDHKYHLGYQPALDGLRAIAVLMVIGVHYEFPTFQYGYLGVDIFFVLSGFLITTILCQEWLRSKKISLKNFYVRRIARLYPALIVVIIVFFPFIPYLYILSSLFYFTNWVMALHVIPIFGPMGHTWSLSLEEQYYLVWPIFLIFLFRHLPSKKMFLVPLALALLSAAWRVVVWSWSMGLDGFRIYDGTDVHADGILIGSALGLATVFGLFPILKLAKRWFPWLILYPLIALLSLMLIPNLTYDFFVFGGHLAVDLAIVIVIVQLVIYPQPYLRRIFEFPLLVNIGKISYGLYLWHVPILNLLPFEKFGFPVVLAIVLKLGLTFGITLISYRYIERPIQRRVNSYYATISSNAAQP